jgi:SAM-dependent methyltransferase
MPANPQLERTDMIDPAKDRPLERFGGLASGYDQYRPDYPPEAVEFIVRHCRLTPGKRLVDIGCGTGISTRTMARMGLGVIGIEPNPDMRHQAEGVQSPAGGSPTYLDGRAEATGLPDASADVVMAAQAFHWFKAAAALAEAKRILRPGGWLILIWNEPDRNDPFTREYVRLLAEHSPEPAIARHVHSESGEVLLTCPGFEQAGKFEFRHSQYLDRDGLRGRALSASYAPREAQMRQRLGEALDGLFKQYQRGDLVELRYLTPVFLAQKPA